MAKPKQYTFGDQPRLSIAFTDPDNADAAYDPTGVVLTVWKPDDADASPSISYVHGTDAQLVKDSVGNYHADIDADTAGTWSYHFQGTGTGKAADRKSFEVLAKRKAA